MTQDASPDTHALRRFEQTTLDKDQELRRWRSRCGSRRRRYGPVGEGIRFECRCEGGGVR